MKMPDHEHDENEDLAPREHPLDLAAARERLGNRSGKEFWRSLEELSRDPHFEELLHREFPRHASEWSEADGVGRRDFLKLMAASLALAGISGCARKPNETILPYVKAPEGLALGKPLYFATAMPMGTTALGLLVESHEGRPTKIEGNPDHPGSLGATDVFAQAAILGLYDPDRSQVLTYLGEIHAWSAFLVVEPQNRGLRKDVGGAKTPRMIRIPFDFCRTAFVTFYQQPERHCAHGHCGRKVEWLAERESLGRFHVRQNGFIRRACASGNPRQRQRRRRQLQEIAPANPVGLAPFRSVARKFAMEQLFEVRIPGKFFQAAPEFFAGAVAQPLAGRGQVEWMFARRQIFVFVVFVIGHLHPKFAFRISGGTSSNSSAPRRFECCIPFLAAAPARSGPQAASNPC